MRKLFILTIILALLTCCVLSVDAVQSGKGEEQYFSYTSLLSGFDNGKYVPEDESTVTQLIAEAVRLHGIYYGTGIEESYDEEEYLSYAFENSIIYEGLFEDYTRGATRAEAVFVLSNAVPSSLYSQKINSIVLIPDCEPSAGYYAPVKAFYEAGIVNGYDKYGAFRPGAAITNKDFSDMLNKLVKPEIRESVTYEEYASKEAFYLIDDFLMNTAVRNIPNIGSGWRYDYTGSLQPGVEGQYTNKLIDITPDDNISVSRQIFPQHDGVLTLEVIMAASVNVNGITINFVDGEGNAVFTLGTENDKFYSCLEGGFDKKTNNTGITSLLDGTLMRIKMELDLEDGTASSYVGGTLISTHKFAALASDISEISISTGIPEATTLEIKNVHLYKNYKVNDVFRVEKEGNAPFGYTTTGDIKVQKMTGSNASNTGDINSVKINAKANANANAHKQFKEVGGLVKLEAYMLLPTEDDGAYFTASYKNYPVFKIETRNGKFYYGEKELYDFSANIWQNIHVEANTNEQTFLLRINGKLIDEALPFANNVPAFDNIDIGITPDAGCVMWFDDVEVHEMFEYDDYCPEPKKLKTDYYVSMSVCNLWRNGSHYGWEYIAPHDDLTPYLGYYDEGFAETMDWEIKFLAEHGVSFYNMCWYAPACPQNDPIKKPRMVDAFHDGFFNAKYSDMLDFTIMFENASFKTAAAYDSFVNNVWPFWIEWYLKDDRYFTIDNKPFIVIYQYANWIEMCYEKPITSSMTQAEKDEIHANAIARANNLFKMMEQDMKDIGYDGLILTFTNRGNTEKIASECLAISAAGVFPYNWGSAANTLDNFKTQVEAAYKLSSSYGIDLLAVGGIGFNHIGWKLERWDLMSTEEFTELLMWFRDDFMKRYATKYKNDPENLWKSKFIQFATWNEYGEGHYLYPSNVNGFGYLDAIAEVFGAEEHDKSLDVMPTDAQKARVGRLYPGYRNYIRRKYFIQPQTPVPDVVSKAYDFTQTNSIDTLKLGFSGFSPKPQQVNKTISGISWSGITYSYSGEIKGTSSNTDPILSWKLAEPIEGKDFEFVHVKLGSANGGLTGTVYFIIEGNTNFSEDYKLTFNINEPGVHDYYIPTSQSLVWNNTITHFRIDPGSLINNEVTFHCLELMNYSAEIKGLEIFIDNSKFEPFAVDAIRSYDNNEVYIAPSEEDNFYRQLHIVYDWNVHTKKLRLETPNETVFEFEEGSDTVLVNGKAKTLAKKFEVYDGCPVIPLIYILDTAGYDYVYSPIGKKLEIFHIDVSTIFSDLENGNAENEYALSTFYNYVGQENRVKRVVDPENEDNYVWFVDSPEGKTWNYFRANTKFEPGKTYTVDFDFKLGKLSNGNIASGNLNINVNPRYCNTSQMETVTSNHYDHAQVAGTAKYSANNGWIHVSHTFTVADDYVTTDLDGKEYTDTITMFINPVKLGTEYFGVDYYVDNFTVRTFIDPVKIINGDAEEEMDDSVLDKGGLIYNIKTETLEDGTENRYWSIDTTDTSRAVWVYYNQFADDFIAGAKYYYEVDIKIGKNASEQDVVTSVSLNARYYDILQTYLSSNPYEHAYTLGTFTSGDGWVHCEGTFDISRGYKSYIESGRKVRPRISFFVNPSTKGPNGTVTDNVGVELMFDNFKVYSTKPAHFK